MMASEPIYGKGIVVASGFDLSAKSPLDSRSIVNTIEERDAHVKGNRVYPGMTVFVLDEQKEYRYTGTQWIEILNDLNAVHTHNNKDVLDNITALDISTWNAKSDFSGSYNDLIDKPTIPTKVSELTNDLSLASETFVTNKIAEAKLEQGKIDLSGFATKDDLLDYVSNNDLAATLVDYVTINDLKAEGYTTQTYVDNKIATHEHVVLTSTEAETMFNDLYK